MDLSKAKESQQEEHYRKVLKAEKHGKPELPVFARVAKSSKRPIKISFS
tara:strand:- start:784 stop:930 length:147 start_codon:yes stop_codon:yes gene_type:complete